MNPDLSALLDFTLVLNRQTDFEEILSLTARKTADLLRAESAFILMINPGTQETVKTVVRRGKKIGSHVLESAERQITGWMMHEQQPFVTPDLKQDARLARLGSLKESVGPAVAVLLKIENLLLGSMVVFRKENEPPFADADVAMLEYIAAIAAPYLRNVEKLRDFFAPTLSDNALLQKYAETGMIGGSPQFVEMLRSIEQAARCDVRVVLEGATGTGKELIARAIHRFSDRANQPFVAVDCGAITEGLVGSELFGHKKGAFTGAIQDRKGLIEEANGGTLFIDEIANLPLDMQAKLMRFLQEGEVRPLGSNMAKKVNVRIFSASSQSLRRLADEGKFRDDLYFRLHVYPVYVPSLRDRNKDVPLLANHFLVKFAEQQGKQIKSFHLDVLRFMRQRSWLGNIRELENFVERLVALAALETQQLDFESLPPDLKNEFAEFLGVPVLQETAAPKSESHSLKDRLKASEEKILREALDANDWNQSKAARELDISEQVMRYRMKKLGVVREKS